MRGGAVSDGERERSATRVLSLPSERQCSGGSNAHPIGRTDHLTPAPLARQPASPAGERTPFREER